MCSFLTKRLPEHLTRSDRVQFRFVCLCVQSVRNIIANNIPDEIPDNRARYHPIQSAEHEIKHRPKWNAFHLQLSCANKRSLVFVFGARDPISRAIRLRLWCGVVDVGWCWVSAIAVAAVGMSALYARRGNTARGGAHTKKRARVIITTQMRCDADDARAADDDYDDYADVKMMSYVLCLRMCVCVIVICRRLAVLSESERKKLSVLQHTSFSFCSSWIDQNQSVSPILFISSNHTTGLILSSSHNTS